MAILDARALAPEATLDTDVCIVGSGAAGLAIANELERSPIRVVVLESGGRSFDAETQSLYRGQVVGQAHAALDTCRLRYFGGTTNHWTAHVRRLEPADFEDRPWVAHSGWPLRAADLDGHYARAAQILGIPQGAFGLDALGPDAASDLRFPHGGLVTQLRYILPRPMRAFGPRFAGSIERSPHVDAYLHANLLRIELDDGGRAVRRLRCGTLDGGRFSLTARRYVLATGGIENPRLLLLSSVGDGLPVGAFFANHPESWAGYLQPTGPVPALGVLPLYRRYGDGQVKPFLRLSPELQRRHELQNGWIELTGEDVNAAWMETRLARQTIGRSPRLEPLEFDEGDVASFGATLDPPRVHANATRAEASAAGAVGLRVFIEPTPNPQSRVRLSGERDAFGQQRVALDWRLDVGDDHAARRTLELAAGELAAAGWGRVRIVLPEEGYSRTRTIGSHHHMGTTRMHPDPRRGVVDADCFVHGVSNLAVAGSSVFPTFGTANPTFTILALALRLSDRLRRDLA